MSSANWSVFEQLPGSVRDNFEKLCRALVRCHFGQFGQFAALAAQPGIEFHLKLHTACSLGKPGRWFGWQCRWYDLPSGKSLGTTRRNKIERALRTTEKVLPGITDWVLWTRYPLTKGDQTWFFKLKTKMRLLLWTATEAEEFLSGPAEIYRGTYFGELILTPKTLADLHNKSIARIKRRWVPEIHQQVEAERTLLQMLGEIESWKQLATIARGLEQFVKSIELDFLEVPERLRLTTKEFTALLTNFATFLTDLHILIEKGDLDLVRQSFALRPSPPNRELCALPRRLRFAQKRPALVVTNALSDLRMAIKLIDQVDGFLGIRLVAIMAEAGAGKTQLAAQMTAPNQHTPAGLLFYGQDLHAGQNLNDLVSRTVIPGTEKPVSSMEALIAAVDAAGQRARRRLPILIDGLNEAEDPRDWKAPLASLNETLQHYPYVLVVCTLRTGSRSPLHTPWDDRPRQASDTRTAFADEALPEDTKRLEMLGFGVDTNEAIRRYFHFFKINPGDAQLPYELLSHPLTLRLFCEVANPAHEHEVGIEAMPESRTALFDRYLQQAAARIAELAPRSRRYYEQDVRTALDEIGIALWEQNTRELGEKELRPKLGDQDRPWNESLIRAMEQEGVILRVPGTSAGSINIMPLYDALAGHLVGNAILSKHGRDGFEAWLKQPMTLTALNGEFTSRHPLAKDIFRALVGLVPRRLNREQLWRLLDEPLRSEALLRTAALEGSFLDASTISELSAFVSKTASGPEGLFERLYHTRSSPAHPLNALFLDSALRTMSIPDRDLLWTEWIRRYRNEWTDDLHYLEAQWRRDTTSRKSADSLRARWAMWTMTSTVRPLRDQATRTLYWFGRGDAAALMELAIESLGINDPYVSERMLAATYGVLMAQQGEIRKAPSLKENLPSLARCLFEAMFQKNAPYGTTHTLTREYAARILELVGLRNHKLFSKSEEDRLKPPFKDGGIREWKESTSEKKEGGYAASPFQMDFGNYTLGRLVEDRGNYDYSNPEYQRVRAEVLWRVEQLGWSHERFKDVDRQIANIGPYSRSGDEGLKTERYGKKYSWIAYYEMAGLLRDQGKLTSRFDLQRSSDVDLDPSFPEPLPVHRLVSTDYLGDPKVDLDEWIRNGPAPDITPFLRMTKVNDQKGPWIALDGFFTQQDEERGRRVFCFIRSFVVARRLATPFAERLRKQSLAGRWLPEKPELIYTFAGEVPWCETFPENGLTDFNFVINEKTVKAKRRRVVYFLDGKRLSFSQIDFARYRMFGELTPLTLDGTPIKAEDVERITSRRMFVEEEEIQRQTKVYKALTPVTTFDWESYHSVLNAAGHAAVLAREVCTTLDLVAHPQTFDLFTKSGIRVTYGIADNPKSFNDSQKFLFMQEEALGKYLKRTDSALVWAIWGEREYSNKAIERRRQKSDFVKQPYRTFQKIKGFMPRK